MKPLTARDAGANDILHLLTNRVPRDCPRALPMPEPGEAGERPGAHESIADAADGRLPEAGNAIGFLHVLLKTELELSGSDPVKHAAVLEKFRTITTRGQARDYVRSMRSVIEANQTRLEAGDVSGAGV